MDVFRTMIVPANLVGLARALGAGLGPGGVGMFTTALSASGNAPATHYISSGYIPEQFADCLATGATLRAACLAAGASVSLAQCNALVNNSDVSDGTKLVDVDGTPPRVAESPFEAMARVGVRMVEVAE